MDAQQVAFQDVATLARRLSPLEQFLLIEQLINEIKHDLVTSPTAKRSLYGLCADLGPAPSASEIDQVRHEMWSSFPRGDI
jgi:hypothetical protein